MWRSTLQGAVLGASCLLAVGLGPQPSPAGAAPRHCDRMAGAPVPVADPADPADRGVPPDVAELIRQVHQASLVEIWIGQRAQKMSDNASVRWVGHQLTVEHERLDKQVAEVAMAFDISLPEEPTLWQQTGARKMAREQGRAFDLAFANTLFYGHDRVMSLIRRAQQEVDRPGIDPKLKGFVAAGEQFVARHKQWLLATGLVTTASTETAGKQVDTAQVMSRTNTFSNAIPALVGMLSLLLIVGLVTAAKLGPALSRRRRRGPA
jgi:predicted outer membrane protein